MKIITGNFQPLDAMSYLRTRIQGFALISALWFAAILTVLSLAISRAYLSNTKLIIDDIQRIQSDLLHDAALRYAALVIVEPKDKVSASGINNHRFIYPNPLFPVQVVIRNESSFIDLSKVDHSDLDSIFENLGLSQSPIRALRSLTNDERHLVSSDNKNLNFRWLRKHVKDDDKAFNSIVQHATFYNGSGQINPYLANPKLLKALPNFKETELVSLIEMRDKSTPNLISRAINHPMFSNRLSGFYRVTTTIKVGDNKGSKTRIIRISNVNNNLLELVAEL